MSKVSSAGPVALPPVWDPKAPGMSSSLTRVMPGSKFTDLSASLTAQPGGSNALRSNGSSMGSSATKAAANGAAATSAGSMGASSMGSGAAFGATAKGSSKPKTYQVLGDYNDFQTKLQVTLPPPKLPDPDTVDDVDQWDFPEEVWFAATISPDRGAAVIQAYRDICKARDVYDTQLATIHTARLKQEALHASTRSPGMLASHKVTGLGSTLSAAIASGSEPRKLERFEEQQRQWSGVAGGLARKLGGPVADLAMERGPRWRHQAELLALLERAKPVQERQGASAAVWPMSLRDAWERIIPLGNIFSGLSVTVKDTPTKGPSNSNEIIGRPFERRGDSRPSSTATATAGPGSVRPLGLSGASGADRDHDASPGGSPGRHRPYRPGAVPRSLSARHRTWKDSEALAARQAWYAPQLRAVLPHRPLADTVAVRGEALEAQLTALATAPVTLAEVEGHMAAHKPEAYAGYLAVKNEIEAHLRAQLEEEEQRQRQLEIAARVAAPLPGPHVELSAARLAMSCHSGGTASATFTLQHKGTAAVHYTWHRQAPPRPPHAPTDLSAPIFFLPQQRGTLLPGHSATFTVTFVPQRPGVFTEAWQLSTSPPLAPPLPPDYFQTGLLPGAARAAAPEQTQQLSQQQLQQEGSRAGTRQGAMSPPGEHSYTHSEAAGQSSSIGQRCSSTAASDASARRQQQQPQQQQQPSSSHPQTPLSQARGSQASVVSHSPPPSRTPQPVTASPSIGGSASPQPSALHLGTEHSAAAEGSVQWPLGGGDAATVPGPVLSVVLRGICITVDQSSVGRVAVSETLAAREQERKVQAALERIMRDIRVPPKRVQRDDPAEWAATQAWDAAHVEGVWPPLFYNQATSDAIGEAYRQGVEVLKVATAPPPEDEKDKKKRGPSPRGKKVEEPPPPPPPKFADEWDGLLSTFGTLLEDMAAAPAPAPATALSLAATVEDAKQAALVPANTHKIVKHAMRAVLIRVLDVIGDKLAKVDADFEARKEEYAAAAAAEASTTPGGPSAASLLGLEPVDQDWWRDKAKAATRTALRAHLGKFGEEVTKEKVSVGDTLEARIRSIDESIVQEREAAGGGEDAKSPALEELYWRRFELLRVWTTLGVPARGDIK